MNLQTFAFESVFSTELQQSCKHAWNNYDKCVWSPRSDQLMVLNSSDNWGISFFMCNVVIFLYYFHLRAQYS